MKTSNLWRRKMSVFNYAPFGVAQRTGGSVTIDNKSGQSGGVASHTGGTVTIIDKDGKVTTVVRDQPSSESADQSSNAHSDRSETHRRAVNIAPGGVRHVGKGETVVINNN